MFKILEFSIGSKREIAKDSVEITLNTEGRDFKFIAGQYVRIVLPNLSENVVKGNSRDFTIASSPTEKNRISIGFRKSKSAFKKHFLELPIGAKVIVQGPFGVFTFPEDLSVPIVYLADGMGIMPIVCLLRFMQATNMSRKIQIFYSNSRDKSFAYLQEIIELTKQQKDIKILNMSECFDVEFIRQHVFYTAKTLWYLCGHPTWVITFMQILPKTFFIPVYNIRTEEFPGYHPTAQEYKILPPVPAKILEMSDDDVRADNDLIQPLLDAAGQSALISITDAQGIIIYVNDKFVEISQYSRKELIGETHRILKSGLHSPEVFEEMWKTISSGHLWRGEVRNRSKDGSFYWVDATITPIYKNGKIHRYVAVRFLITDKKLLEKERNELSEITNRLKLATHSAKIGVFEWIVSNNAFIANEEFYSHYKTAPGSFVNFREQFASFLSANTRQLTLDNLESALLQDARIDMRFEVLLVNGSKKTFRIVAQINRDDNRQPTRLVGVLLDVTLETEVDRMKTEFVSFVSHQLGTPLTEIMWLSDMLINGKAGHLLSKQEDLIKKIYNSNERMTVLVHSLLDLSKMESGHLSIEPSLTDLKDLSARVLEQLESKIKTKNIHIMLNVSEEIPKINIDPKLIFEVYQNLFTNAVKYTPDGGQVVLTFAQTNSEVISRVSDTGYGIPKDQQDKIFQKFFRADNATATEIHGTGLGLYMTKTIVELSGGKIGFESEEGKGTTFWFSLPK